MKSCLKVNVLTHVSVRRAGEYLGRAFLVSIPFPFLKHDVDSRRTWHLSPMNKAKPLHSKVLTAVDMMTESALPFKDDWIPRTRSSGH